MELEIFFLKKVRKNFEIFFKSSTQLKIRVVFPERVPELQEVIDSLKNTGAEASSLLSEGQRWTGGLKIEYLKCQMRASQRFDVFQNLKIIFGNSKKFENYKQIR